MQELNMTIDDIMLRAKFNCSENWNNYCTTNCYAYALGLDIPEKNIINHAYQPGTIGSVIFNIDSKELNKLSLEEKINLDLKALNISYSDCSHSEISYYGFDKDFIVYQWIIAIFEGYDDDFHFMKKSWDETWWHKRGYCLELPRNYDDDFKIIHNPEECKMYDGYRYIKCLKLNYKTSNYKF